MPFLSGGQCTWPLNVVTHHTGLIIVNLKYNQENDNLNVYLTIKNTLNANYNYSKSNYLQPYLSKIYKYTLQPSFDYIVDIIKLVNSFNKSTMISQ